MPASTGRWCRRRSSLQGVPSLGRAPFRDRASGEGARCGYCCPHTKCSACMNLLGSAAQAADWSLIAQLEAPSKLASIPLLLEVLVIADVAVMLQL